MFGQVLVQIPKESLQTPKVKFKIVAFCQNIVMITPTQKKKKYFTENFMGMGSHRWMSSSSFKSGLQKKRHLAP